MFVLQLNDMRSSNIENTTPVTRAETVAELERLIKQEKVESYKDENWHKGFRKGGPLEWFNTPFDHDPAIVNAGTADEWAENARRMYQDQIMVLPDVNDLVPSQVEGVMTNAG